MKKAPEELTVVSAEDTKTHYYHSTEGNTRGREHSIGMWYHVLKLTLSNGSVWYVQGKPVMPERLPKDVTMSNGNVVTIFEEQPLPPMIPTRFNVLTRLYYPAHLDELYVFTYDKFTYYV